MKIGNGPGPTQRNRSAPASETGLQKLYEKRKRGEALADMGARRAQAREFVATRLPKLLKP